MAVEPDNAWTARLHHFDFGAAAQSHFVQTVDMFGRAHHLANDGNLAVGEQTERQQIVGNGTTRELRLILS